MRPGRSSSGSSASTRHNQRTHSRAYWPGRVTSEVASGSRTPASAPSSPPSIFATAVPGSGLPIVARLKATHGATQAATGPAQTRARRQVSGPDSQNRGSRRSASGRARAPRPSARAAGPSRSRNLSTSAAVTSRAARETSMPDSAPQTIGPASAVRAEASRPSPRRPVQRAASAPASQAVASASARPRTFARAGWGPSTVKTPPSASVQSGAVDPETGTPGL